MSALGRALRGALRGALGLLGPAAPPPPPPARPLPAQIAISVVGAAPFRMTIE